jgi:hypothetical protein
LPDSHDATNVLEYRTLIETVVRVPLDRQNGATIDDMRRGIRILDALDAAHGELTLEDADWSYLKQKVEHMPWASVDRRILRFVDDVLNAGNPLPTNGQLAKEEVAR